MGIGSATLLRRTTHRARWLGCACLLTLASTIVFLIA